MMRERGQQPIVMIVMAGVRECGVDVMVMLRMGRRVAAPRGVDGNGAVIAMMVAGMRGRAGLLTRVAIVVDGSARRIAQQRCGKPIRADLEAERPVGRRHESRWDQRTNDHGNQQRADHPEALFRAENPAHCCET